MNKAEFIKEVATKAGKTQKDVKELLEVMQTVVFDTVKAEDEVKVFDGVCLMGVHKDACVKRNPIDGTQVNVPEKTAIKAKFGKTVKDYINA